MACWLWSISPKRYPVFVKTGTFALRKVGRTALEKIQPGDTIFAYLSGRKVIAGMFEATASIFEDSTPLIPGTSLPHRLRVRPVAALSEEDWVPYEAFHDKLDVVADYGDFRSVVQQVIHPLKRVDEKVLEFLVRAREASDLEKVLEAYDAYLQARRLHEQAAPVSRDPATAYRPERPFVWAEAMEDLLGYVEGRGFLYAPWQVAAYVTALRTKPFVLLAGVTGTGKSKLPVLVAEGTGGTAHLVPVRPDWTDSADVLGYVDLQGRFRPGAVLAAAQAAQASPLAHHVCVVDEMNLARVEHYFAEVLSQLEARRPADGGGYVGPPLLTPTLHDAAGADWADVALAPNFGLVGTVNMDESAHGFSRKVLDRAFTLELADVDLTTWQAATPQPATRWPTVAWHPRAIMLAELTGLGKATRQQVDRTLETLAAVNAFLTPAQVQIAYRSRDEIVLFLLHAADYPDAFRTPHGDPIDPLDLVLHMKVLPRLQGGNPALRAALLALLGWATTGIPCRDADDARPVLDAWQQARRPNALPGARFPRTVARCCLMWERMEAEGFTSYWV